jgi:hypothetical protein
MKLFNVRTMPEDLQKYLDEIMHEQNNRPIAEFEGYSPAEMHSVLHFTFEEGSPIGLQTLDDEDYIRIPILNQIKYLAKVIMEAGEVKLTKLGFLPTRMVADIYAQGFIKDKFVELRTPKQIKEADVPSITLSRILLTISGLVKKRTNKLSLTTMGQITIQDDDDLLQLIIKNYGSKYNWAYFDGYGQNSIGQLGFGFSLILLSKYGHESQQDRFYAQKYFMAFPALLNIPEPSYSSSIKYCEHCYSFRVFENFMTFFGLADLEWERRYLLRKLNVSKTALLDKLINIEKPKLK